MSDHDIIVQDFHKSLKAIGCKGAIVSGKHVTEITTEIQERRNKKLLNSDFYEEYKNFFEVKPDVDFPQIKSIFIVAHPHPATEVIFHHNDKQFPLLVPPTYLQGLEIIEKLKEILTSILSPKGYNIAYARIPLKTLSVHSGLTEYGRNNITYVNGMGSFYRLSAYYSNFPSEQETWREHKMMDICEACQACVRNCPTGAIPTDRFLLRAERCITYHNEHPPEVAFPEWIDPSWHNCLVGCLHCQRVCPANKKVINWVEKGPEFTEEETQQILEGKNEENLPELTIKKLKDYDLMEYLELFPRNIGVFLKNE